MEIDLDNDRIRHAIDELSKAIAAELEAALWHQGTVMEEGGAEVGRVQGAFVHPRLATPADEAANHLVLDPEPEPGPELDLAPRITGLTGVFVEDGAVVGFEVEGRTFGLDGRPVVHDRYHPLVIVPRTKPAEPPD